MNRATNEPAIEERQITIRVLTIGTKQVTQALYQQLVEGSDFITDENGTINPLATIWGWVNVCTSECKKETDVHLHVIYEIGGTLKRSRVSCAYYGPDTSGRDLKDDIRRTSDPERKAEMQGWLKEYEASWKKTLQTIRDADQLFIAVSGVWK